MGQTFSQYDGFQKFKDFHEHNTRRLCVLTNQCFHRYVIIF